MQPESELPREVDAALERLDAIVRKFEEHPEPAVQDYAVELLRSIDTIHRAGLQRLNELLKVAGLQRRATDDPEVRLLFDLYDLGEGGEQQRGEALLDIVRPAIEGQGGRLELVQFSEGALSARLIGAFDTAGGPASAKRFVEHALCEAWPDLRTVEIQAESQLPDNFVPLSSLRLVRRPQLVWHTVSRMSELPAEAVRCVDIAGESTLLVHTANEVFAYRNACPGTPFPLDGARLDNGVLICPWHSCRFDIRGGRRLDAPDQPGLGVVPVSVEGGEIRIGTTHGAAA